MQRSDGTDESIFVSARNEGMTQRNILSCRDGEGLYRYFHRHAYAVSHTISYEQTSWKLTC